MGNRKVVLSVFFGSSEHEYCKRDFYTIQSLNLLENTQVNCHFDQREKSHN